MRKNNSILFFILAILMISFSCQLPQRETPLLFSTSTPDITGTAFFSALQTPTLTPQMAVTATSTTQPEATETGLPSETPNVTQTPTYQARNGVLVLAVFKENPPVIDGNLSEWNDFHYPVKSVVYGSDQWSGSNDLSGEMMIGWDINNLYLGGIVIDDQYVQNGTGETIFRGDSLEVLLDTDLEADQLVAKLSPDDYQLGVSPGRPSIGVGPETYLWFPVSISGPRNRVSVGATKTDLGYQVEVLIPWQIFELTVQPGLEMGFAISISDNDLVGQTVQQTMISLAPTRHLTDPTTWGKIVLVK